MMALTRYRLWRLGVGKRQRVWADRARFDLRERLGGVCVHCGSEKNLEFDCIEPQGDRHHRMESSIRVSFYRKEFRRNNLQLLCRECHIRKSLTERPGVVLIV